MLETCREEATVYLIIFVIIKPWVMEDNAATVQL